MATKFTPPPPLPSFSRGPCPKCGHSVLRPLWCNGYRISGRPDRCPPGDHDHMHLTCPECAYWVVTLPKDGSDVR